MRPGRFLTVVDAPRPVPDGGRSASERARRWSICLRTCQTVVDPPPNVPDGGRSASERARRWSIRRHLVGVSRRLIDHRLRIDVDVGRSMPSGLSVSVVERPLSTRSARRWPLCHRDTPVACRRIDHCLARSEADRPPSGPAGADRPPSEA